MKKNLVTLVISSLIGLLLLELCIYLAVTFLNLNIDKPAYSMNAVRYRFWADINPIWGTWHEKNSQFHLKKSCIDVNYRANSYGSRDIERPLHSTLSRIVVLGDSFVEGYGVKDESRVSNLLEKMSGIEFMNFATSGGFGVTQEYLLYKTLAKKFDHQIVLLGILPFNDFYDDDPDFGRKVYPSRYKPYFEGEAPNYKLTYNNPHENKKSPLKAFLRGFSYTFNAIERLSTVLKVKKHMPDQNTKGYSGYYDYTASQLNRLKFTLKELRKESQGKTLVVFTIPVISDFLRYEISKEAPLPIELTKLAKQNHFIYIDLLPEMFDGDWNRYKLPCDNHWSEYGNERVSDILYSKLKGLL